MTARAYSGASAEIQEFVFGIRLFGLLSPEMNAILLVFVAEHFEDIGVGQKVMWDFDGKRFRVHLRIIKGHFYVEVSEVTAMEALGDVQSVAMRVAHHVKRRLIVETGGFHYECVALPMASRVSQISGQVKVLRQLAPVGKDLAPQIIDFVQDHCQLGRLNDLNRLRKETGQWEAKDKCTNVRGAELGCSLAKKFFGCRPHQLICVQVHENIERVLVLRSNFHSGR